MSFTDDTARNQPVIFDDKTRVLATISALGKEIGNKAVSSPFGAWLLLASTNYLSFDETSFSEKLMAELPEGLTAAAAAWGDVPEEVASFVETGPIPSKGEADAWTSKNTQEMIKNFPTFLPSNGPGISVLATALAVKTFWSKPLTRVEKKYLSESPFLSSEYVLQIMDGEYKIEAFKDENDEPFVVTTTAGMNGITIYSVLTSENVSESDSITLARRVASGEVFTSLSWGDAAAVLKEITIKKQSSVPRDIAIAYVPAWTANEVISLNENDFFTNLGADDAVQVAYAKFDTEGFEAAAVTSVTRSANFSPVISENDLISVVYDRPFAYAVSAGLPGSWKHVPLFEGLITEKEIMEPSLSSQERRFRGMH